MICGTSHSTRHRRFKPPSLEAQWDNSDGRYIVDLEASIPLSRDVRLAVGGQNIFDTFSQRMDLFADIFGLPYSQFTPWGLSGGYYYARLNYTWGR